jgi:3',5'-cyclic AMP phosphodiesterase CpdA
MRQLITFIIIYVSIPVMLMNISSQTYSSEMNNNVREQEPLFSFGMIADIQYACTEPVGTRFYRSSLYKLREAVTELRKDSVDFVITLGDMIDRDIKSYEPILNILDSSGLRFYHITGNHDYSVDPEKKRDLPAVFNTWPGYYSLIHKNYRFIFLNGNEISTYSSNNKAIISQANTLLGELRNRGESNAVEWNGGISDRQLAWLDDQMNKAACKNEKVLIFCHFPVFPENIHNLLNYNEVLDVLADHQHTIAWFNGHNHAGNYGRYKGTHFVTMKGMVESETQNSFARIDVCSNKICIIGSGRENSRILEY